MASKEPSWADQWGAGGIGAMAEDDNTETNKEDRNKKKMAATSVGLCKVKAVAMAGAHKIKTGTNMGINWVKKKCQKKKTPANE